MEDVSQYLLCLLMSCHSLWSADPSICSFQNFVSELQHFILKRTWICSFNMTSRDFLQFSARETISWCYPSLAHNGYEENSQSISKAIFLALQICVSVHSISPPSSHRFPWLLIYCLGTSVSDHFFQWKVG